MPRHKAKQIIFFVLGIITLVLAYLGIVLPGFPGTPFILLTAYFFVRSSDRMYNWLLKQKLFAKLINSYESQEKLPLKFKIGILIPFLISIVVAEILFIERLEYQIALGIVAFILSVPVLIVKKIPLR